jgi:fibronectin type 3 domain-containing protein
MRKMVTFLCLMLLISLSVLLFTGGCTCDKNAGKPSDKIAPRVPNGISITAVSLTEIKISWKPSADDSSGFKGYKVYRNGTFLKDVAATSFSDTGLTPKVKTCYRISALDKAGNESIQSTEVCAIL